MIALALRLKTVVPFLKIFANIFFYSDKFSLFSLETLLSNRNTAKEEKENKKTTGWNSTSTLNPAMGYTCNWYEQPISMGKKYEKKF